jgi:hypothetical protein
MGTPELKFNRRYWASAGVGLAVIAVGVIFLLRNFGIGVPFLTYRNWWALFIFVGAVPSLTHAAQRFHTRGTIDAYVVRAALPSIAVIMVALIFLLELDWGKWWPLFVIYGGLWLLAGRDGGPDAPASS